MAYTYWFSDTRATDLSKVGGKGANLSRLAAGGFPVPPGFCVTADAYRYLIDVTGLNSVIEGVVEQIDFDSPVDVSARAAEIRDLIEQQPIPTDIASEILECYFNLGRLMNCRHLEAAPVAVRSSATAEDLPDASFAGQQDTYLNVRGGYSLLEHVRRCWASLWTDRALTYRHRQGFDHHKVYVAVVVQAMVNPRISGILFTANPLNNRESETVINASWGLGEAIVSGIVTPDTFIVDNQTGLIIDQQIASKDRRIVYSAYAGAVEEEVPEQMQRQHSLTPAQVAHLTALSSRVAKYYGKPQDIEWAHADENWYILQARPITTLDKADRITDADGRFSRAMFVEIFPDGLSPSFLSVVSPLLADMLRQAFRELGFRKLPPGEPVREFLNQPYLSVDYIEAVLADLNPQVRRHLVARFTNIFGEERADQPLNWTQLSLALRLFSFMRRFRRDIPGQIAAYHKEIERISAISLPETADYELLANVRQICFTGAGPLLNNDFLLIAAISVCRTVLTKLLKPAYGDKSTEIVDNLLSGVSGNVVMKTNNLIWDLAQAARKNPFVQQVIRDTTPDRALDELKRQPEAAEFLGQMDEVLRICGHREHRFDICYPTWAEDPAPVLAFVRSYLGAELSDAPEQREEKLIARRTALTAEVYDALGQSFSGRVLLLPLFKYLLGQAQWLVSERDTMHFEWTRLFPPVRRMQLEVGRRWQQNGLIDHASDIFFLTLSEQEQIARFPKPCHTLVKQRKGEYEVNLAGPWPELIVDGCDAGEKPQPRRAPFMRDENAIAGIGGSPGSVTGRARIILGPNDFPKLQQGEILVAPMTNPTWTPLFAIAGGIATEVGGVLSHGAIVAREYGIPAVMSAEGITRVLADGDTVTIDGDRGLILRTTENSLPAHKNARNHTESAYQSTA